MNKLYELLQKIKQRPGLYLGVKSLTLLNVFIGGYAICQSDYNQQESNLFNGFQEHIQKKYKISSTQSWAKIIDFYSATDADAFDLFFKLFEEFLKDNPENLA